MKDNYYRYKVLSTLEARHFYLEKITLELLGLPLLLELFTIDAITSITNNDNSSFKYKLFEFISKHATNEEKISLLKSFRFSKPFILGEAADKCHHVLHKDVIKDKEFLATQNLGTSSYYDCAVSSCICFTWLQEKKGVNSICPYILDLCSHLKDIRNAQVHELYPVFGLPKERGGLVYAEYPLKNKKFVMYSCTMSFSSFSEIITNGIKKFFISNFID